jgi:hypothetical protein
VMQGVVDVEDALAGQHRADGAIRLA